MFSPTRLIPVPSCNQGLSWMRAVLQPFHPRSLLPKDLFPRTAGLPSLSSLLFSDVLLTTGVLGGGLPQRCLISHMVPSSSACLLEFRQPWTS